MYKRNISENKLLKEFSEEILVKESRVTDVFLIEFKYYPKWKIVKVILIGNHDFRVHNSYFK